MQVSSVAGVDVYMHYNDEFARSDVFDHYRVVDIGSPSYWNVAQVYEFRGRVPQPTWLLPPRIAAL